MTDARIIAGDFADIKTVKSRGCVQMVIEIPIEEGEQLIKLFGFPQPATPVKVAVARLVEGITAPNVHHLAKRQWDELPLSQQAGIRCNEESFQRFLREEGGSQVHNEPEAATYVRMICGVNTRAAFTTNEKAAQKWRDLDRKYQAWMQVPA